MVCRLPGWLIYYYIFEWNLKLLLFSGYGQIWIWNENVWIVSCLHETKYSPDHNLYYLMYNDLYCFWRSWIMKYTGKKKKEGREPSCVFPSMSSLCAVLNSGRRPILKLFNLWFTTRLRNRDTWILMPTQINLICCMAAWKII